MQRNQGSSLIFALVTIVVLGGLTSAFLFLSLTYHRASTDALTQELAYQAADSGISYYVSRLEDDENYFVTNPAPQIPITVGSESFELESATPLTVGGDWELVVVGRSGGSSYRMGAALGFLRLGISREIVSGANNSDNNAKLLQLDSGCVIGAYDPTQGGFDPLSPEGCSLDLGACS